MIRKPENIIIGTANFGHTYNGFQVSVGEQEAIWQYALQQGIKYVDTATVYGQMEIPDEFDVIRKVRIVDGEGGIDRAYCVMSHCQQMAEFIWKLKEHWGDVKVGHSMYSPEEIPQEPFDIAQVQYNLFNRTWEPYFRLLKVWGAEVHCRSIFARGDLLKNFTVKQCIDFVADNPHVDKIVVGVESKQELEQIVKAVGDAK